MTNAAVRTLEASARSNATARLNRFVMSLLLIGTFLLTAGLAGAQTGRQVLVNRSALSADVLQQLEAFYRVEIPDGSYWYDGISGLWGYEGGPALAQIHPGLPLGGPLRFDASGGGTDVVINGRALHRLEVAALIRSFGAVYPGRYWMNAQFVGGIEGGPAIFDLGAGASQGDGRSILGHSLTGSVIGGGDYVGFIDGATGFTCGPDGGCF